MASIGAFACSSVSSSWCLCADANETKRMMSTCTGNLDMALLSLRRRRL